jgi:acyl-homoserine-lactone acylase
MAHSLRLGKLLLTVMSCSAALLTARNSTALATEPRAANSTADQARWRQESADTVIVRDDWGIAHVHGHTDADAVFGMMYAQAEDDFNRIETNYLNALGRLAEAEGESALWSDLRQRLFIDPKNLQSLYRRSPAWLQRLEVAWADGLNFYLNTHPGVHPRVITRFEPWMALSFSEGSIGGDIERVDLPALAAFYGAADAAPRTAYDPTPREPGGSNGIAIAPANSVNHHALLLINPHTSFFFRSELAAGSDEGLDVYGAATWGQFFIYQGFNERVGWMHTSSGVDNVDFYAETIDGKPGHYTYRYGSEQRPVGTSEVILRYRDPAGRLAQRRFTTFRTQHGPVIGKVNGHWLSVALMNKPVEALSQSYLLTKARNYREFMQTMEFKANSSNNTVYADADGNIAYLHPQFIPRRDDRFDYTEAVDGSNPATDWRGLHTLDELPQVRNPSVGWIMNTNNWPYSAAGPDSPKRENFPRYMDTFGETPRGIHATLLLTGHSGFSAESLNRAAYDDYLPAFARLIPLLLSDYDALEESDPMKAQLAAPIRELRAWDFRWAASSVATTLAVLWGDDLWAKLNRDASAHRLSVYEAMASHANTAARLSTLQAVCTRLTHDFGEWRVAWGDMNRYQRRNGDIEQRFADAAPSVPVPFTSGRWGSLAAFGARRYEGTTKYYGTNGNSFVAVVEFGDHVSARAVSIGGESGHPDSPHFADQVSRYVAGALRPVYFYPADLEGHVERRYHPE